MSEQEDIPSPTVWRQPDEETVDLYPGLVVHDGRHSGSITIGRSRLPLQSVIPDCLAGCQSDLTETWGTDSLGFGETDLVGFLCALLEQRGELARLILALARVEADCDDENVDEPWWLIEEPRAFVLEHLQRCVVALGGTQ